MLMSMAYLDQILHGGGSRSNTKGEYVVLVWQKTLPTEVASPCVHCFREAGSCVSVLHAYFSCMLMYIRVICTPTNLRMRNATYWYRGDYTHTNNAGYS